MAEIKVSTQEIRNVASDISEANKRLVNLLDAVHADAKGLVNNAWTSDAATDFVKKLDAFKARTFDNYKNFTEEYASFLLRTADKYEKTEETNITNVTSEIQDSKAGQFS